jgi:hypothetical protein
MTFNTMALTSTYPVLTLVLVPSWADTKFLYQNANTTIINQPISGGTWDTTTDGPLVGTTDKWSSYRTLSCEVKIIPSTTAEKVAGDGTVAFIPRYVTTQTNGISQASLNNETYTTSFMGDSGLILHWIPNGTETNFYTTRPVDPSAIFLTISVPSDVAASTKYRMDITLTVEYIPKNAFIPWLTTNYQVEGTLQSAEEYVEKFISEHGHDVLFGVYEAGGVGGGFNFSKPKYIHLDFRTTVLNETEESAEEKKDFP